VRSHAENGADGDHTGAAHSGDQNAVDAFIQRRTGGLGQYGEQISLALTLGLAQRAAQHRDEARAEALHAGEILVARRLIYPALAAQRGLAPLHRHSLRLLAAIGAAIAHLIVVQYALCGVGEGAALAATAFFRRTALI